MSKIIGIVGSPRKNGNTSALVSRALQGVETLGIETEMVFLSDLSISPCTGCEGCRDTFRCVVKDDMQHLYDLLDESVGIILGSPTYFYNVTALTKAFIERLYCLDAFDSEDRSVWISKYETTGIKYASVIAVCEQQAEEDMGVTSMVMKKSLEAVGYRVVSTPKFLRLFRRLDHEKDQTALETAYEAGLHLAKTIRLTKY